MYKIKEAAEIAGVSPYTLRYYEKEGILPPINRDSAGRRVYNEENLAWINIVTCLKKTDMPVVAIKEIVRLSIIGDETIDQRRAILHKHRLEMVRQLEDLKKSIENIDKKIAYYDGTKEC